MQLNKRTTGTPTTVPKSVFVISIPVLVATVLVGKTIPSKIAAECDYRKGGKPDGY